MSAIFATLSTLLPFLFVLGVLIFVHELGHFLVARFYGVRVVTFSLGFGPKILKFKRGDTEYCISIVPLGGYVKLAGESVEDERTGAPDEFMSKSKWIRFQVYLAGPIMNLGLAVVLLTAVLLRGADVPLYETSAPIIGSVAAGSAGEKFGLKVGDQILSVAGKSTATWNDLDAAVVPKANQELSFEVLRDGQTVTLAVTPGSYSKFEIGDLGVGPRIRPQFTVINPGKPADRAGLKAGDVVLAVGGEKLEQPAIIAAIRKNLNVPMILTVERNGEKHDISVTPEKGMAGGMIGVTLSAAEVRRVDPTFFQAVRMSAQQNYDSAIAIGQVLGGLFKGETPVKQLMGPVAIAELSGDAARLGFFELLRLMVMISLNLGLLNLLPVPVLDGGQIAIIAFEGLIRRDLSIRVKERILLVGAALIVMLMVTVIYNDVARLVR